MELNHDEHYKAKKSKRVGQRHISTAGGSTGKIVSNRAEVKHEVVRTKASKP